MTTRSWRCGRSNLEGQSEISRLCPDPRLFVTGCYHPSFQASAVKRSAALVSGWSEEIWRLTRQTGPKDGTRAPPPQTLRCAQGDIRKVTPGRDAQLLYAIRGKASRHRIVLMPGREGEHANLHLVNTGELYVDCIPST